MRRFSILMAAGVALVAMVYGYTSPQKPGGGARVPRDEVAKPKGAALVKKLPEGVEGVVMEEGVIKLKPGFKFVKNNNKVRVMSLVGGGSGGGPNVGGEWDCVCKQGIGSCSTMVEDNQIYCAPGGEKACPDRCVLSIRIKGSVTKVLAY